MVAEEIGHALSGATSHDVWVAATARKERMPLLTADDSIFRGFPEITLRSCE